MWGIIFSHWVNLKLALWFSAMLIIATLFKRTLWGLRLCRKRIGHVNFRWVGWVVGYRTLPSWNVPLVFPVHEITRYVLPPVSFSSAKRNWNCQAVFPRFSFDWNHGNWEIKKEPPEFLSDEYIFRRINKSCKWMGQIIRLQGYLLVIHVLRDTFNLLFLLGQDSVEVSR